MFRRFCMGQKLRSIATSLGKLPSSITGIVPSFLEQFGYQQKQTGTFVTDFLSLNGAPEAERLSGQSDREIPKDLIKLLAIYYKMPIQGFYSRGVIRKSLTIRGVEYKRFTLSPSDSYVLIQRAERTCAARIEAIFDYRTSKQGEWNSYLAVKAFKPLSTSDAAKDLYRAIPRMGCIYQDVLEPQPILITPAEVISHLCVVTNISTEIPGAHILALPIGKVRLRTFHLLISHLNNCCLGYLPAYRFSLPG